MRRAWRGAALRCSAVVLTAAAVAPVASGIAAVTEASAVPSKLVGKWTRTITKADVKRGGGLFLLAGKVAKFTVVKNGHFTVDEGLGGNLGTVDGNLVPAGPNRIHINVNGVTTPNVYAWRVSGRLLTLTKLKDSEPDRVTVMWGVWKRK